MTGKIGFIVLAGALLTANMACETTASNTNTAGANRNGNANTNVIVTQAPTATPMAKPHSGDMTREEYEKDKDSLLSQAKAAGRKIGNGAEDGWLWTKTRAALAAADDLRDTTINVDLENNAVTLTGTVANAAQKARAEKVAKGIDGVKSVKNQLKIVADTSNSSTPKK